MRGRLGILYGCLVRVVDDAVVCTRLSYLACVRCRKEEEFVD